MARLSVFANKSDDSPNWIKYSRWVGLLLAIIAATTFCYLHVLRCLVELPRNSGGIVGQELGDLMVITFGNSGATLLVLATFFAGVTLYTNISWLNVMQVVGKYTLSGSDFLYNKLTQVREKQYLNNLL